jgi:hypothetical protein
MEGKKFSTPISNFHIKNGIVYSNLFPDEVTIEKAKTHVEIMKRELKGVVPFLGLVDISQAHKSMNTKVIRDALNDKELDEMTTATALVANSFWVKMGGNLFLRFIKMTKPISFFSTEAEALKWLEQYR